MKLARSVSGMSRATAAARAGIVRSTLERIEAGDPGVSLGVLVAATAAVGVDLVCATYPGREHSLRDFGQLTLAKGLVAQAHSSWQASFEEPAGDHAEAIDLVLWGPREILAVEIESRLVDWQAQSRRHEVKRAWLAARHARPVRLITAVSDRPGNRSAIARFSSVTSLARPAGTRAVLGAVRSGQALGSDGICWLRRQER